MSLMFLEMKLTSGAGVLFFLGACCLWFVVRRERREREEVWVDKSSANLRAASAFGQPQVDRHVSGSHSQAFACVFCKSVGYFCFHSSA